jgi:hypothetical protein
VLENAAVAMTTAPWASSGVSNFQTMSVMQWLWVSESTVVRTVRLPPTAGVKAAAGTRRRKELGASNARRS